MEALSTLYQSTNAIVADAVLVGVFVLALFIGSKVGLFRSLMSFVTAILSVVGATHVTNRFSGNVVDWLYPKLEGNISEKLEGMGENKLNKLMEDAGLQKASSSLLNGKSLFEVLGIDTEAVAKQLLSNVVRVFMLVILFIVLLVIFKILVRGINQVLFEIPVVGKLNHVGGAVLAGLVWGLVLLVVLYVLEKSQPDYWVLARESAPISRFLAEHNPVLLLLEA